MSETDDLEKYWRWYDDQGFSRLINVSGTMTGLGSSITNIQVCDATIKAMRHFVNIHELQAKTSSIISRLTGAEAGCLTASASAGITLAVAGCMTGVDPGRVEALPAQPGLKSEIVVQLGHMCGYGAPVELAIELTGAKVRRFGQSTLVMDHQLETALTENTAAALYVVSHHVVRYGQIPFERFTAICRSKKVPVIVDAASEYDLRGFIRKGADIVIYSAHKFLAGPTAGIIAGKRDLVRAAYLQNIGIGRGMKIGKESIAGAIEAMIQWMSRDHEAVRKSENETLELWEDALTGLPGVTARKVVDPTGNPLSRLQVDIDAEVTGVNAATFARALGQENPAIIVRSHETKLGYFQLDPCNLIDGQAEIVSQTLRRVLKNEKNISEKAEDSDMARNGGVKGYLSWLTT